MPILTYGFCGALGGIVGNTMGVGEGEGAGWPGSAAPAALHSIGERARAQRATNGERIPCKTSLEENRFLAQPRP